jgi:hypothetical protein
MLSTSVIMPINRRGPAEMHRKAPTVARDCSKNAGAGSATRASEPRTPRI